MRTPDAFFDYLKQLSEQSRLLQVIFIFFNTFSHNFVSDYLKQRSVKSRLLHVQIVNRLL